MPECVGQSWLLFTPIHPTRHKYYRGTCKTLQIREGQRPRCPQFAARRATRTLPLPGFASVSIISVLSSIDVTRNDLRRFVPICGHNTSKTKLAGQTLYPTYQSPQSAACFYLIPNRGKMNSNTLKKYFGNNIGRQQKYPFSRLPRTIS